MKTIVTEDDIQIIVPANRSYRVTLDIEIPPAPTPSDAREGDLEDFQFEIDH